MKHSNPWGPRDGAPLVMGILNITPDSFSDGGRWSSVESALRHALDMVDRGADIIDIGAESTRPGFSPVSAEMELGRLEPVLREIIPVLDVPVSVDTMKTVVAERCLALGAAAINDVNGLRDPGMAEACASAGAGLAIMHSPHDVREVHSTWMGDGFVDEIRGFLSERAAMAVDAGMDPGLVAVDPGIGFGKTMEQNVWLLDHSSSFSVGHPLISGSSRKRVIREAYPGWDIDDASADAARRAVASGADIVRVHDVARTRARISQ